MAYLFLPKNAAPPFQTLVYFPGSYAIWLRSSEDIAFQMPDFLPRSGRALVFPIYKSTYERGDGFSSDYNSPPLSTVTMCRLGPKISVEPSITWKAGRIWIPRN